MLFEAVDYRFNFKRGCCTYGQNDVQQPLKNLTIFFCEITRRKYLEIGESEAIDDIDKIMGQIGLDILHGSIHDSLTAFFRSP